MYERFIKRVIDILFSFTGLILLTPVFLVFAMAIKLDSKGPVFFRQRRIGKNKREFAILKFRTMKIDAPRDTPTHLLKKPEKYITAVGRFLRGSSLDELPQLLNILKGDMSIVGPRPALWNQHDLIAERDKNGANGVRPGLTGWAQVNGRDRLSIKTRAELDGYYVKRMGPLLDIEILLKTPLIVLRKEGINEGSCQAEKEHSVSR